MDNQLKLYESIIDDAVDAIFVGDENGKFIFVNKSAEQLTGYAKPELLSLRMSNLFSQKQLTDSPLKYSSLDHKQIITRERDLIRKDGSIVPVEMKSKKLGTGDYQSFMRDISNRRKREKKLKESEAKIQSIMRSAPVGIGFVRDRVLEYVNDHLLNLLGYSKEEMIGQKSKMFYETIGEFDKVGKLYDELKTTDTASIETRIICKSDEVLNVQLGLSFIDNNDPTSGVIFSVLDITENKKMRDSLIIEQTRYENLFENSPVPLWEEDFKELFIKIRELKNSGILDLREYFESNPEAIYEFATLPKIINVNQATLSLHNANSKEELYGSLTKIFTDNSLNIFKEEMIAISQGKRHFESEGEVRTLDNKSKFVDMKLYLDFRHSDSAENYLALLATVDITDRVLAEREVKAQLERNLIILNTMNDGFIFADDKGKIIDVNPAYCKLIGYPAEKLKTMDIRDLEISVPKKEVEARIKRMIVKGHDNFETQHITNNDEIIDLAVSISIIDYKDKHYVAAFVRDITLQKLTLENLNKSRKEMGELAQHLQNIREEERHYIASEIHDDLGQSLTALKLDTSILLNRLPDADSAIINKLNSMKDLADQTIKTVQKISSELRPGILDDLGLAAAIEWETKKFAERTNIKCKLNLSPTDISFSEKINITVFRLFQETCTNVARHSKATELEIQITEEKSKLFMNIIDNGMGMTKEQFNSPKSFGLLGIKERLKNFGGSINYTSEPNSGTKINIVIPLVMKVEI
jgi:PAS domain S-box-containing protein